MTHGDQTAKRLTTLETALTHLQSDYDSLNEVVLDQAKRLDEMALAIARLTARVEAAMENADPRDPVDEKPPHY